MSLDTDLGVAIRAVERERGSYAPEYNMSRLLGASGESITRARKRYIYLTGVIERLEAHREDLRSETQKHTGGYATVTGGQETSKCQDR